MTEAAILADEHTALLTAFQKLDHIVGRDSEGVRIMAPTGELGYVPEEHLAEALAAGARVMTPEDMRILRQQVFMEHGLFQDERKRPDVRRKRKSLVKGRKR